MDFDEYETLPTNNFSVHLFAGAAAGVMEHCVMYPLDSVKIRNMIEFCMYFIISIAMQIHYFNGRFRLIPLWLGAEDECI